MLFNKILKQIKPKEKEKQKIQKIVDDFTKILNKKLVKANTFIGGSFAKGTWISSQHDIDVFVLFEKDNNISLELEKALKKCFKYEVIHGSRDYFIVHFKGLVFEIIPVLKVKDYTASKNTTDLSPMHVSWVNSHINDILRDEVLVCKQFLKANNLYGAETFIGGLHGYLVEILIIHYHGFFKFIKAFAKIKPGEIIDPNKHSIFNSEQNFSLIVIDPVHPNRNVAAAFTEDKFNLFVKICKEYLRKPSEKLFNKQKLDLSKYNIIIKAKPVEGSIDVSGTKLLKIYEKIVTELKNYDFIILNSIWNWDKQCFFCFKLKDKRLSNEYKHFGPPIDNIENYESFKDKYLGAKQGIEKGKAFVILEREFKDAKSFLENLLKNEFIKSRTKSIEIVKA